MKFLGPFKGFRATFVTGATHILFNTVRDFASVIVLHSMRSAREAQLRQPCRYGAMVGPRTKLTSTRNQSATPSIVAAVLRRQVEPHRRLTSWDEAFLFQGPPITPTSDQHQIKELLRLQWLRPSPPSFDYQRLALMAARNRCEFDSQELIVLASKLPGPIRSVDRALALVIRRFFALTPVATL